VVVAWLFTGAAVFGGGEWVTDLLALAVFSAIALPSAVYALAFALRLSRSRGSLAQFAQNQLHRERVPRMTGLPTLHL